MIDALSARDLRTGGKWSPAQRYKNDAIYALLRMATWIADRLPRRVLLAAGRLAGMLVWLVLGWRRGIQRPWLVRAGENLCLCLLLRRGSVRAQDLVECDPGDVAVLEAALGQGRGAVVVSAHLGPFELVPALVSELGHRPAIIVRQSYDPRLDALVDEHRHDRGITVIHRGRPNAGVRALGALRRGQPLGLLPDLPSRLERVGVILLDRPAELAVGPARLARLSGAPLLVATLERPCGRRRHRLRFQDIVSAASDAEAVVMQRVADALSRAIRGAPDEWLGSLTRVCRPWH